MKVLVTYMSKTGNTKKVAEAIFQEINGEKEIKRIDDIGSIEDYDVTFLGFPIIGMGPDKKSAALIEKHCINGRKVALFITHASPEDAEELPTVLDKFREAARGADIIDMFDCQGQLAASVKLIMHMMPDAKLRLWAKTDNSKGQPDESRIEKARIFTRNVMEKLQGNCDKAGAAVLVEA